MKDFFYAIADLFVDYLFIPFDALRSLELDSWWGANVMSWIFLLTLIVSFVYWMKQLRIADKNNEEDKSVTAHSYL